MNRQCPECYKIYDDALCLTYCPHERFISDDAARRKDLAFSLVGKRITLKGYFDESRIQSIDGDGYVNLIGVLGSFDPYTLEVIKET